MTDVYKIDWRSGQRTKTERTLEKGPSNKPKLSGKFIMGPIPLVWLSRAGGLTKSALKLALVLSYLRGLTKRLTFRLEPARCREFGLDNKAKGRGLNELEEEGLIEVERRVGAAPMVTLLDWG
ncbi:MAG: hypothetical protein ACI8UO_002986 [Verrucomicrobiales bacterium]|jgi:hypothetical protein